MLSNPNKCSCLQCKRIVSTNNINKHYKSKSCIEGKLPTLKLDRCKYCSKSFEGLIPTERANHSRWCESNPRSKIDKENMRNQNDFISAESRAKAGVKISKLHKEGVYKNSPDKMLETRRKNGTLKHTPEGIENCKKAARKSNHQRRMRLSHEYKDKRGRVFIFDSSWEDCLANRLDELDLLWIRPEPITWKDSNGIDRKYFADFYLPDYDLYLDPKNSHVELYQKEKLDKVSKIINLKIIRSKEECKNFTIELQTYK